VTEILADGIDLLPAVCIADTVVVYTPLTPQGYRTLARTTLTLPHQETAINSATEKIFRGVTRDRAMIPADDGSVINILV